MKHLAFLFAAVLLVVAWPPRADAQEEWYAEYEGPLEVVTTRAVPLRRAPSDDDSPLRTLPPGTRLRLLDLHTRGGFNRVQMRGQRGWVWAGAVRMAEASSATASETRSLTATSSSGPCLDVRELASCPASGCATEGSRNSEAEKLLNETKHGRGMARTPVRQLSFRSLKDLQEAATAEVGQGGHLDAAERARVRALGEGRLVRLSGFLAIDEENPRQAGPESVNCRLSRAENNDIHINITARAGEDEFDGMVIEMTPEMPQRADGTWTRRKLLQVKREGRRVLIEGQLFYDNRHLVRGREDTDSRFNSQPKRFTLWEIHPVRRFFICTRARNDCDPRRLGEWTTLEAFAAEQ